jgi:hypothetical protein
MQLNRTGTQNQKLIITNVIVIYCFYLFDFYFIGRYGANERWDHWCTKRKEKKKVQKDLDDLKDSTNCGWNETRICPITDAYK